jgi:DNA topoisomerase IA
LVKELEKRGIGRPSTYAAIISTIQDRGYVKLENRRLFAEKMGEIVTDRLDESFNNLMNYALPQIWKVSLEWQQVIVTGKSCSIVSTVTLKTFKYRGCRRYAP